MDAGQTQVRPVLRLALITPDSFGRGVAAAAESRPLGSMKTFWFSYVM